jgi:hypothetical protein
MTAHKDQIDAVIRDYGTVPRGRLPGWLCCADGAHEFDLAMAVELCHWDGWGDVIYPVYDGEGLLIAWHGIDLKKTLAPPDDRRLRPYHILLCNRLHSMIISDPLIRDDDRYNMAELATALPAGDTVRLTIDAEADEVVSYSELRARAFRLMRDYHRTGGVVAIHDRWGEPAGCLVIYGPKAAPTTAH